MSNRVALTWDDVRGRSQTVALVCGALLSRLLSFGTTVRPMAKALTGKRAINAAGTVTVRGKRANGAGSVY
jgi:hypothetical protein